MHSKQTEQHKSIQGKAYYRALERCTQVDPNDKLSRLLCRPILTIAGQNWTEQNDPHLPKSDTVTAVKVTALISSPPLLLSTNCNDGVLNRAQCPTDYTCVPHGWSVVCLITIRPIVVPRAPDQMPEMAKLMRAIDPW